jgi:hypothetical protein
MLSEFDALNLNVHMWKNRLGRSLASVKYKIVCLLQHTFVVNFKAALLLPKISVMLLEACR